MSHDVNHSRRPAVMSARLVLIAVMLLTISMPATAEPPPPVAFQLALLHPIQLFDSDRSVKGFRYSVLHGANQDVTGVDLSSLATVTHGSMRGLQISVANEVSGDVVGLQIGAFMNHVEGDLQGVQLSGVTSRAGGGTGVQIAPLFADVKQLRGFQLGIITRAEELVGLQLGLLNFNKNGFLPVFPIFNFGR